MRKYCVIGTPVAHSKSPELFKKISAERGLVFGEDLDYLRNEITDTEQLEEFISDMRKGIWDGCNVTMPWKTEIVRFMDELSENAKYTGAVNTVAVRDGHLFGDSTDGKGMLNAIRNVINNGGTEDCAIEERESLVILGCGGAARSIIAEAVIRNFRRVVIVARGVKEMSDTGNLGLTVRMLDNISEKKSEVIFLDAGENDEIQRRLEVADILINATPLGMLDGRENENNLPLPENINFRKTLIVADCVYNPDETLLIKKAEGSGCRVVKGIKMLEEQARCGADLLLGR